MSEDRNAGFSLTTHHSALSTMKSVASILAAPALCLAVLGGIFADRRGHTREADAEPFHRAAKAAIDGWPTSFGEWSGRDWEMPQEAVKLLRPNARLGRRFVNSRGQYADLLIVQCKSPEDMSGHYPPNCYGQSGEGIVFEAERTWRVGDLDVTGTEYHFQTVSAGQTRRRCVYNFFVLPGRGILPDMDAVYEATGDYQLRHYGAAQFQVVFDTEMHQGMREEIFVGILSGFEGPAADRSAGERPYAERALRTLMEKKG